MRFLETINEMNKMVKDRTVPGISYAIIDHHQVIKGQIGNKEIVPKRIPLLPDQIYDLASLTKVIGTVPVILQLIENNQLKLSDSISKYLPRWKYPKVTVRHLLTHTSGIEGYIPNRDQLSAHDLITSSLDLRVGNNFDQKMVYTDTNFIFLGLIARVITKKPIQTLIEQRILKPLNMMHTSFDPIDKDSCVPTEIINGNLLKGKVDDPKAQTLGTDCGSAGMFSNIEDLIKFCDNLLYPDHQNSILSSKMIRELFKDHTTNHKLNRSFGWGINYDPHFYIYQSGYTGTEIALKPQQRRGLIFLSNRIHPKGPNLPFLNRREQVVKTFINEK